MIPQLIILWYSENILIWVGQPELAAKYAGIYIRYIIPGLWFYAQVDLLRRFLASQGEFHLIMRTEMITSILHPIWLYIMVHIYELKLEGVAIATCITFTLKFLLPFLYVCVKQDIVKEN
mmetsp:Transcript_12174/g.10794  ORF Transcript_12174/g.10794 Transcript_12174/m.10794 type:complete len:120 (+) Transcript_12174:397-756(+)